MVLFCSEAGGVGVGDGFGADSVGGVDVGALGGGVFREVVGPAMAAVVLPFCFSEVVMPFEAVRVVSFFFPFRCSGVSLACVAASAYVRAGCGAGGGGGDVWVCASLVATRFFLGRSCSSVRF